MNGNVLSRGMSEVGGVLGSIRAMDFYRKIPRDLTEPTLAGGTMSVLSTIVMGMLLLWQVRPLRVSLLADGISPLYWTST